MRVLQSVDLPDVYRGWFQPIERIAYYRSKPYNEYFTPEGESIRLKRSGYSGTAWETSRLASMVRHTGGVLLRKQGRGGSMRIYARAQDGNMIIPRGHPMSARIHNLSLKYMFHYTHGRFVEYKFMEVAISCFGEPKDRRYEEYILGGEEAFTKYSAIHHLHP